MPPRKKRRTAASAAVSKKKKNAAGGATGSPAPAPAVVKISSGPVASVSAATATDAAAAAAAATAVIIHPSYPDLVQRKRQIEDRLQEIKIPPAPTHHFKSASSSSSSHVVPVVAAAGAGAGAGADDSAAKIDTHHDYMLKELQWLAADFSGERNRHLSQRRKLANALKQHFATREVRRIRKLADAETRRRRLAAKISRDVKGWWTKLEKVVTFKQKLESERGRRKAMNGQLVKLVRVTEKYTDALMVSSSGNRDFDDDGSDASDLEDGGNGNSKRRNRRRRRLSIEEALAEGLDVRRSKARVTDYARLSTQMDKQNKREANSAEQSSLYGESTASDHSSDSSWSAEAKGAEKDDETTISEAEHEEVLERRRQRRQRHSSGGIIHTDDDDDEDTAASFQADPLELLKLREESKMDVQDVIARFQQEGLLATAAAATTGEGDDDRPAAANSEDGSLPPAAAAEKKCVKFDDSADPPPKGKKPDPGEDADDDADISDVEDFVESEDIDDDDADFEVAPDDVNAVDDETTIAQEEALPQEMSREEEIKMLEEENELPVEELRKRYAAILGDFGPSETDSKAVDDVEEEEEDRKLPARRRGSRTSQVSTAPALEPSDITKNLTASLLWTLPQRETPGPAGTPAAAAAANTGSVSYSGDDNEEFQPDDDELVDDETTIEAEERLGRDMSYEDELALLKRESEMSVDDLRALYAGGGDQDGDDDDGGGDYDDDPPEGGADAKTGKGTVSNLAYLDGSVEEDQENDDEYRPAGEEKDDETTIEAEERLGREMSVEDEIALLRRESEEPVESLVERYRKRKPDEKVDAMEVDDATNEDGQERESESEGEKPDDSGGEMSDAGRTALDALEKSAERARRARATRPYILAPWVKLREYQQVGLNWLVSLHSRRLNGVLADQMGLGKTLQTIALLAYLAAYKGIWGPHLIIVPTSVLLNWETEFKRFCPALKVLCYYGPAKTRKELRTGWTNTNWYHVVITSYQLAVQDAFAFKRKKWYYLVLDEAQNIKNFQSQRWQTLINFRTQRRLLLTGTPLQNNLMELWSLLHFLMPYIFRSRKEFSYWFANPMSSMIEGGRKQNDDVINRLHGIIRPFVLRRLKKDVEKQMPGKFEHIVKCQLSRRQMFIYEEFLARSSTRQALAKGGNFMGMMNVLMQLRKVCNHPDLFEPRAVITPFVIDSITLSVPSCTVGIREPFVGADRVSSKLLHPLWCGSAGLPSSESALRHDEIEAEELHQLMEPSSAFDEFVIEDPFSQDDILAEYTPALKKLLLSLNERHRKEKKANLDFLKCLNDSRCRSEPFAYPSSFLQAVKVIESSPREQRKSMLTTPASLLEMRRDQQQLAEDMDERIRKFVFSVPSASARKPILDSNTVSAPGEVSSATLDEMLLEPLEEILHPFRNAQARLTSSFPDKSLIQFDAGKLQTLAGLLRELKRGGHRVLIFTQMSKMLDILEAFLNLNGHTYLRLDGSTGVDRRQRLMDRFNSDPKIFCFILSTRSGGLGINLTGADSVVFYDQDWNPAMDAQAQDRAHRIGQTREVHIYRLVTEHTIEENILVKAQQKRNLDILVMDKGNFDASQLFGHGDNAKAASDPEEIKGVFTEGGLRAILGAEPKEAQGQESEEDTAVGGDQEIDKEMEKAMASLEDLDDVQALRGAQKEAAEELKEFDDSAEIKKSSDSEGEDGDGDGNSKKSKGKPTKAAKEEKGKPKGDDDGKQEEEDLEKEFAAWQDKVGMDADAIEASLSPAEKYGLRFREEVDPYYSIFAIMEYRRKMEAEQEDNDEVDVTAIEREKALEEKEAIKEGDLLGSRPRPEDLIRQRNLYQREKARLRADKKRRKLSGENWESRNEALTNLPFWYNVDTGEARWDKPTTLLELEAYEKAQEGLFSAMPMKPLIQVMGFLSPSPDRMSCASVCRQWHAAANDPSFVRHVYPVEMGAYTRDESKMDFNHYRSISDALAKCLPGDSIELGDGHYWEKDDLAVDFPVRFVGDENNAANVVVEMSGTLCWKGATGWMEGITFRRPKIASGEPSSSPILSLDGIGKIDMIQCIFDNRGGRGDVIKASGSGKKGSWESVAIKGGDVGVAVGETAELLLEKCGIYDTARSGVRCTDSSGISMTGCELKRIGGLGFELIGDSRARLKRCRLSNISSGILKKEFGCTVSCRESTVTKSTCEGHIPGFRLVE